MWWLLPILAASLLANVMLVEMLLSLRRDFARVAADLCRHVSRRNP